MNKNNKPPAEAEEGKMGPRIDFEEIKKLIALLEEKNLALFELEIEGLKIKINRNVPGAPPYQPMTAVPAPQYDAGSGLFPAAGPGLETGRNAHTITSPMVGTFYRAPAPNADPFAEIGDVVKKGQTLCIIEAMKLLNEIESDADGVVTAIYVENGKPVEYGQKLFAIQTPS
jgi:acetyl-CoA carboxylase biotin carboxyl carrier protein